MACFLVPAAEAVVTTAAAKIVEKKETAEARGNAAERAEEKTKLGFSHKLRNLSNFLWGGSVLLAFEHVWHGEVTPFFPFLTAAGNPADTAEMLHEMSTVGVGMAVLVTVFAVGVSFVSDSIAKRQSQSLYKD